MSPPLALAFCLLLPPNDPLPAGALARFGTNHLRATGGIAVSPDGGTVFTLHGGRLRGYRTDGLARVPVHPLPTDAARRLAGTGRQAGWTPDGRFLAVAEERRDPTTNGTGETVSVLTVFDLHTGSTVGEVIHPFLWGGQLSPDGRRMVAVVSDVQKPNQPTPPAARVCVWDVPTGERRTLVRLPGHDWQAYATLAPDGNNLIVCVTPPPGQMPPEAKTHCIDVATGDTRWTVPGWFVQPYFPPGGRVVLVGSDTVTVHDLATGKQTPDRLPPTVLNGRNIQGVVFSLDGERMVVVYTTGGRTPGELESKPSVLVWHLRRGVKLSDAPLQTGDHTTPVRLLADGTLLACSAASLRRFDPATGRPLDPPAAVGHLGNLSRLEYTPAGRLLVSHGFSESISWAATGATVATWQRLPFTAPGRLSADGRASWAVYQAGKLSAHDPRTGARIGGFDVALAPAASTLAPPPIVPVVMPAPPKPDTTEQTINALAGTAVFRGLMATQYPAFVAFLVYESFGGDPAFGEQPPAALPPPPAPPPPAFAFDGINRPTGTAAARPDGAAVVYFDSAAYVVTGHDPKTGQQLWKATVTRDEIRKSIPAGAELSPDGRFLAGNLGPIDTRTGRLSHSWAMPKEDHTLAAPIRVSADSRYAAGFLSPGLAVRPATNPQIIRTMELCVWETATGLLVAHGGQYTEPVPFAFVPTCEHLALACKDGLCIWDLRSNLRTEPDARVTAAGGGIDSLAVSPDGTTVAVGNRDGTILTWPMPPITRPKQVVVTDEWDRLGKSNGFFSAASALLSRPDDSVRLLETKLVPTPSTGAKTVGELVRALDAPRYADREAATKALRAAGPAAEPELKRAAVSESPEVRQRAAVVLASFDQPVPPTNDAVRSIRAVGVLEHAGTPAARRMLEKLATGGHSSLTTAARDALARLTPDAK